MEMINNEYKIEIYAESTIEGIIESFKNLKDVGMQGYIEIENKKIYETSDNFVYLVEQEIKRQNQNVCNSETKIKTNKITRKESSSEEKDLYNYMFHCLAVRLNSVFNYYLGIVLKYIKPEYKQDIIKYYINVYGDDSLNSMRDLHVFAQIVNILDNEDKKIIIEKLNFMFANISKEDENLLFLSLSKIRKYTYFGDLVDLFFNANVVENEMMITEEKIKKYRKNI